MITEETLNRYNKGASLSDDELRTLHDEFRQFEELCDLIGPRYALVGEDLYNKRIEIEGYMRERKLIS